MIQQFEKQIKIDNNRYSKVTEIMLTLSALKKVCYNVCTIDSLSFMYASRRLI